MSAQTKRNKRIRITPEILKQLQDAMNDRIRPDRKEKKDGKNPNKKKKGKPSNGSVERNQPETTV